MTTPALITGLAALAPAADSASELFRRICAGRSCLRTHPRFQALGFDNPVAGFIDDDQWSRLLGQPGPVGSGAHRGPPDRPARLLSHVAAAALSSAGLAPAGVTGRRVGLFVGVNKSCAALETLGGLQRSMDATGRSDLDALLADSARPAAAEFRVDRPVIALAAALGVRGPVRAHADACAAGNIAIGAALRAIRNDEIDIALCGGLELLANPLPWFMFHSLGALCPLTDRPPAARSRPFTRDRAGLVLGEGCGLLVLESAAHAEARGAPRRGRVLGHANRCESYRITSSDAEGLRYAACIGLALADAGVDADGIDHINAHGTSTRLNDACEAAAVARVFGTRLERMTMTANKSALGHSLAAGGAIEAVLSVLALEHAVSPPTLNCTDAANEYPELPQSDRAVPQAMRRVLSNAFGFGGQNSCLVLEGACA